MNPNNQNQVNNSSLSMDLESLRQKYSNLLIQYKAAVADYVNYLNQQSQQPCGKFTANSKGIDQKCYEYIWSKAGCGAGNVQPTAAGSWAPNQTLNGLISDSWYWSTETDYTHRMGCYGNPGNPYTILGIGTDGHLWSRQGLDAPWQRVNDDTNGCQGICTMTDGKGLLGIGGPYQIYTKTTYLDNWQGPIANSCCIQGIAQGQDGTVVGVGLDNKLWSRPLEGTWTQTATPNEWVSAVAIAPDGSIFVIGGGNKIYKKNSYQNLTGQNWQYMGDNTCCVKAITIAPDGTFIGVGTDNQLYTKASYKDLSTSWQGPYNSYYGSCCVTGITTVANPDYDSSIFSTASAPNYKINSEPYVSLQGMAFNGTGTAGQSDATTLQDCQASCANLSNCSGATFVSGKCLVRTGDSPIVPAGNESYAIIPKSKQLLLNMEDINQQLLDTNKELTRKINVAEPIFDKASQDTTSKNQELINNYKVLTQERENILNLLQQYETLESVDNENLIKINQNYYSFILLSILAIAIIFLLYKFSTSGNTTPPAVQYGGELGTNTYYIIFGMLLLIFGINFYNKYFV